MMNLADTILSREEYIAVHKSKNAQYILNYREHLISELLRLYEPHIFKTQYELLRNNLENSFQELQDATPDDFGVLERDYTDQGLTLDEQIEYTLKEHFELAFRKFKKNIQQIVNSRNNNRFLPIVVVPARI